MMETGRGGGHCIIQYSVFILNQPKYLVAKLYMYKSLSMDLAELEEGPPTLLSKFPYSFIHSLLLLIENEEEEEGCYSIHDGDKSDGP